jgi:hypothetical protein
MNTTGSDRRSTVKYAITGPDHETGCERTVAVEADDEDTALRIAKQYGVFACKVKIIVPDRPPQPVATSPRILQPQQTSSAEQQVVRPVGVFLLVLVCFGFFIVLVKSTSSSNSSVSSSSTPRVTRRDAWPPPVTVAATGRQNIAVIPQQRETSSNVLYDASMQSDLRRMAELCGESEERIKAMTWKTQEVLHESGIEESKDSILDGMIEAYPKTTKSMTYAECLAAYATARGKGMSHSDAVLGLKEFCAALGVR